jgi:pimeloyl-ACP methyl ester carboxylesterase
MGPVGRRLQRLEEGRLHGHHRPESDHLSGRRRGVYQACDRHAERPVILVGHSYGGAVITEAGNDPKVAGLVYVTAFALDKGESVSSLIKDPPPGTPVPPLLPPVDGFLLLDRAKFQRLSPAM